MIVICREEGGIQVLGPAVPYLEVRSVWTSASSSFYCRDEIATVPYQPELQALAGRIAQRYIF